MFLGNHTVDPFQGAAHRTLEIPTGFPQLPQGLLLELFCYYMKIWMGLGDVAP